MDRTAALERVAEALAVWAEARWWSAGNDEKRAIEKLQSALAEVERAGEDEDDATLAGMTDAEIDTYLRANGIDPAAAYGRLRVRVKKETGVDLPLAPSPAEPWRPKMGMKKGGVNLEYQIKTRPPPPPPQRPTPPAEQGCPERGQSGPIHGATDEGRWCQACGRTKP